VWPEVLADPSDLVADQPGEGQPVEVIRRRGRVQPPVELEVQGSSRELLRNLDRASAFDRCGMASSAGPV